MTDARARNGVRICISGPFCEKMRCLILIAAILLAGCGNSPSPQPALPIVQAPSSGWAFQFSPGMSTPDTKGGFSFPVYAHTPTTDCNAANCPSVHYLVKAANRVSGSLSLTISIETAGDPVFQYALAQDNTCGGTANVSLYIQRRGDDWSGQGPMASYRWWSRDVLELRPGIQTLTAPVSVSAWLNVKGQSTDASGFQAAASDLQAIGLTFGGGCFRGHGVNIDKGSALFRIMGFAGA